MAVAHDTASESHTASTGSASQASFSWSHAGAASNVKGVLVFTFVNAGNDDATSVTYGGSSLTAVTGGRASDTATELGDCKAWFLGSGVLQGTQTVVVNRTNNADVMYAVAITVTASTDTETFDPVLLQEDQALAEVGVHNGSTVNAVRYAGVNSGLATHPAAGANSTELHYFPATAGTRSISTVRETTAGVDGRLVGFTDATVDDVAFVAICVREVVSETPRITCDGLFILKEGSANGIVTTTILANGHAGTDRTITLSPATPTGLNVDTHQIAPRCAIQIRNVGIVSASANFRSLSLDHAQSFVYLEMDLSPFNYTLVTMFGWVTFGVENQGAGSLLYDYWRINGQVNGFSVLQLDSGRGGLGYALGLETNPDGVTTHSDYIPITPGSTYWCCLHADFTGASGRAALAVYDTNEVLLGVIGQPILGGGDVMPDILGNIRIGNGEAGVDASHTSYMEVIGFDYTGTWPIPPGTPASVVGVSTDWYKTT